MPKAPRRPASTSPSARRAAGRPRTSRPSASSTSRLLPPYSGFSPDLGFGAFKTTEPVLTADCRKGSESLYLRDNETGELHCLSPETPGAPKSPCLVYGGVSEDGARAFLARRARRRRRAHLQPL